MRSLILFIHIVMSDVKVSTKISLNQTGRTMTAIQIALNVIQISCIYIMDEVYVIPNKYKIMIWKSHTLNGL